MSSITRIEEYRQVESNHATWCLFDWYKMNIIDVPGGSEQIAKNLALSSHVLEAMPIEEAIESRDCLIMFNTILEESLEA